MNFIQRIKCLFGRHEMLATHFGTKRSGGKLLYRSITMACRHCGKHGKTYMNTLP